MKPNMISAQTPKGWALAGEWLCHGALVTRTFVQQVNSDLSNSQLSFPSPQCTLSLCSHHTAEIPELPHIFPVPGFADTVVS